MTSPPETGPPETGRPETGRPETGRPRAGRPALVEAESGLTLTHGELAVQVEGFSSALPATKSLALMAMSNTVEAVVAYLALRAAGHAVLLIDPSLPEATLETLVAAYRPELIYRPDGPATGYSAGALPQLWRAPRSPTVPPAPPVHPDLALVLPTSGSTGNPKMVRLSAVNVEANTAAIARSLHLGPDDKPITTLPLSYSYGLSVLHSHLAAGATVVLSGASVLEAGLWDAVRSHEVTSLAGVPYTYRMLERLRFRTMDLPTVTKMTQAGGKLEEDLVRAYAGWLVERGGRFYVMYGQTEASPRMTCLPPDRALTAPGSVGLPLEGGHVEISNQDGTPAGPGQAGEVVYRGPNVMMGYGEQRSDLQLGDRLGGTLRTGDIGYVDEEGYLYLTGRSKRIVKLFGLRVSLDDVESLFRSCGPVAAVAGDESVVVHYETADLAAVERSRRDAAKRLRVPLSAVRLVGHDDRLPVLASGKTDYATLTGTTGTP